jgi:hypothetical protein
MHGKPAPPALDHDGGVNLVVTVARVDAAERAILKPPDVKIELTMRDRTLG